MRDDGPIAKAYVLLSPGNFSGASIDLINPSGSDWLFVRTTQEGQVSLQFIDKLFETLATADTGAETHVFEGAGHATHILDGHPDSVPLIADWIVGKLGTDG